jgi:hypothetical protein
MDGADQTSVCPQCGSIGTGSLFCKNCVATLRPITPLVPPDAFDSRRPTIGIVKRILRGIVKTIAVVAGMILIFDNGVSGVAGIVLLASGAALVLCLFVWRIFELGHDDWFWPKRTG